VKYHPAMHNQLAKAALDLIARTSVSADDQSLAIAMQVRGMLHKIASGQLVVTEPPKVEPAGPAQ
jgi:hypothetical protein